MKSRALTKRSKCKCYTKNRRKTWPLTEAQPNANYGRRQTFNYCSCLDTRQPGNVFKKLDTRQLEIHHQFTRNISLNLCKNIRELFKRLKRFQILLWAWSRGNRRAFLTCFCRQSPCHRRIVKSLAFASRNCSVTPEVERHSSAESTNSRCLYSEECLWRISVKTTDSL